MKLNNANKTLIFYLCRNYGDGSRGETCARVYNYGQNKVALINVFYINEINNFDNFLKNHLGYTAIILIESEDVLIQNEKIPYLLGFDRLALINRKCAQALPPDSIVHFHSKGRDISGDKKENILILGLADSDTWLAWLLNIRQNKLLIKAITTPTLVSASSAVSAGLTDENQGLIMQVAWNYGGISQTVLDCGLPTFTRFFPWLTKPPADDTHNFHNGWDYENAHNECIIQTKKMLTFLQGRGLWSPTLRTTLSLIVPAGIADVKLKLPDIQGIDWKIIVAPSQINSLSENYQNIKNINYGAETLFIEQLANVNKIIQCGQTPLRFRWLNWQYMRKTTIIFALILLAGFLLTGYYLLCYLWQNYKNNQQQSEITTLQTRYEGLKQSFPKISINNDELRQTIYLQKYLQKCHQGAPEFIYELSQINNNHPQIEFSGISWNSGGDNVIRQTITQNDLIGEPAIKCIYTYSIIGNIIALPNNSQRDLQNIFAQWQNQIVQMGARVDVKTHPLDLTKGSFSENSPAPNRAKFEVIVSFN